MRLRSLIENVAREGVSIPWTSGAGSNVWSRSPGTEESIRRALGQSVRQIP